MARKPTKKDQAIEWFDQGLPVEEIAARLECAPTYVANVLIESGRAPEYVDLYTHTGPQNEYARQLQGVLRFRTPEAARESLQRMDSLYQEYQAQGDLRGQHQVQLLALIGRNRAEGIGKYEAADLFTEWLVRHLARPRRRSGTPASYDTGTPAPPR